MSTLIKEERHKFPALADREPDDLVQDFFVQKIEQVTVMLVTQATSDASVGKLLRRSIRHWLIDEARKTGTGPLRRSLEKILGGEAVFEQVPAGQAGAGRWRLAGTDAAPFGDDLDGLVQAARKVRDVRPPRWTSDTRRPPVADRRSITAVLTAVLEAAGGSLETAQLVFVFSRRFAAALDPIEVALNDVTQLGDVPSEEATGEDLVIAADSELDAACAAAEIVGRLSDNEKSTVPIWDDANAVRERLGAGRTQAYAAMDRAKKKVLDLAGTGPDAEQIVREVIKLCR
ncbi:hypothetical protein [Amycolatopsis sp. cmx-4-61]|uniref:hypothetical protein n=1 Tax=Amycolatopsis sp. cmx-4-61 TaxID=2790937 RepID=UPI00397CB903